MIEAISAVTLGTHDMTRAVEFFTALGFELLYGGPEAGFTSFRIGESFLNVIQAGDERCWSWWGRVIFRVSDVDSLYARVLDLRLTPQAAPRDAEWGERYFHITDPDGHELSFVRPLNA
jgi:catechol 2,3-dioxygenase-like lactoylglutathione lyase family enzyme